MPSPAKILPFRLSQPKFTSKELEAQTRRLMRSHLISLVKSTQRYENCHFVNLVALNSQLSFLQESKHFVRERSIEFFLRKKEEGPYWPTLMKDKQKKHWLKIDFNRWRDEDDSEPEENGGAEEQDLDDVSFDSISHALKKFIDIFFT